MCIDIITLYARCTCMKGIVSDKNEKRLALYEKQRDN